jgi:DNA-binding NarL/FixJ family response regulator
MAAESPVRIIVADDHPMVLTGLAEMLVASGNFTLLASCHDGATALHAVHSLKPDVAILDIRMPGMSGLDVLREIRSQDLPTRVLLLTADIDDEQTLEAIRQGVNGVILKSMAARLLVEGVRKVAAGGYWVETESLRRAVDKLLRREITRAEGLLTPSEDRVLRLVAEGRTNGEIGKTLNISEGTVKSHLHNIYSKLEVKNRRELVDHAREKGLI